MDQPVRVERQAVDKPQLRVKQRIDIVMRRAERTIFKHGLHLDNRFVYPLLGFSHISAFGRRLAACIIAGV